MFPFRGWKLQLTYRDWGIYCICLIWEHWAKFCTDGYRSITMIFVLEITLGEREGVLIRQTNYTLIYKKFLHNFVCMMHLWQIFVFGLASCSTVISQSRLESILRIYDRFHLQMLWNFIYQIFAFLLLFCFIEIISCELCGKIFLDHYIRR